MDREQDVGGSEKGPGDASQQLFIRDKETFNIQAGKYRANFGYDA